MRRKSPSRIILLVVSLFVLVTSPGLLRAQQRTSEHLREQAAKLQQDIEILSRSKADLSGRVSASLLSSLESEIQAKQTALDFTQQKIKQAEVLDRDITDLESMLDKMQSRVSTELVDKLNEEIAIKKQALANLSDAAKPPALAVRPGHDPSPGAKQTPARPAATPATTTQPAPAQPGAPPGSATPSGPPAAPAAKVDQGPPAPAPDAPPAPVAPPPAGAAAASLDTKKLAFGTQPVGSVSGSQSMSGTGVGATLSATSLSFGEVSVGSASSAQPVTLTNSTNSTLNIASVQITGTNAEDFTLSDNKCGPTLSANANCTISVTFSPKATKNRSGNVTITYNVAGSPQQELPLEGVGAGFDKFYYETLAGLDLTATSTSGPAQQYFADVSLLRSLGCTKTARGSTPEKLPYDRCWLWFTSKIASVPTPQTSALSTLSSLNTSVPGLNQKTLGDITQSLEFQGGFEYDIKKVFDAKPALISFIAGAGAASPFSASSGSPEFDLTQSGSSTSYLVQQFNATPSFATQYPQLACALTAYGYTYPLTSPSCTKPSPAPQHVAFVLPNRSRFYREYAAGFRIRGFFSDLKTYPITFDVKFGQDETVTGGKLRGLVTTISGDSPLPGASWLRVFGSAYLRWHKNVNSPALVLLPTQIFVALSDPSVVLQPSKPADQDYFRLGFGIDLSTAFKAATAKASTTAAGATPSGK